LYGLAGDEKSDRPPQQQVAGQEPGVKQLSGRRVGAAALIAVVGGLAVPGEAAAPRTTVVVQDPTGDAGPVGGRKDLSAVQSEPAFDITSVAFTTARVSGASVLKAVVTLLGAPAANESFLLTFDVPGCVGVPPFGGVPLPEVTPPTFEAATKQGGVILQVDNSQWPAKGESYVMCRGAGPLQGKTQAMSWAVNGNTVTLTVALDEIIKAGTPITGAAAFTSQSTTGRDSTPAGARYVVPKVAGTDKPTGPQMMDMAGDVPTGSVDIVSLTLATKVVGGKRVLATIVQTVDPLAPGLGLRVGFDMPGCSNGFGDYVGAHLMYGIGGQQAYVACGTTGKTDFGTFTIKGNIVEMDFPLGAGHLLRVGDKLTKPHVSTQLPQEANDFYFGGIDRGWAGRPYTI
jgi:hypothetical protein